MIVQQLQSHVQSDGSPHLQESTTLIYVRCTCIYTYTPSLTLALTRSLTHIQEEREEGGREGGGERERKRESERKGEREGKREKERERRKEGERDEEGGSMETNLWTSQTWDRSAQFALRSSLGRASGTREQ